MSLGLVLSRSERREPVVEHDLQGGLSVLADESSRYERVSENLLNVEKTISAIHLLP